MTLDVAGNEAGCDKDVEFHGVEPAAEYYTRQRRARHGLDVKDAHEAQAATVHDEGVGLSLRHWHLEVADLERADGQLDTLMDGGLDEVLDAHDEPLQVDLR
jgi:hypothetical protein